VEEEVNQDKNEADGMNLEVDSLSRRRWLADEKE